MATKSFSDLQQSKKLAEILPLESADMYYNLSESNIPNFIRGSHSDFRCYTMCWSLSALLGVLPDDTDIIKDKADTENEIYMCTVGVKDDIISTFGNNPVDACVEIIIKLKENKLI